MEPPPPASPAPPAKSRGRLRAEALRAQLLDRLDREDEDSLFCELERCGRPLPLVCTGCGETHDVEERCMRRWCPVCARIISARRVRKYNAAARSMAWPLFVTLTAPNLSSIEQADIRAQRRAFGLLRNRKLWRTRCRGGIAGFEVTNRGEGWHLHLHALIDCQWLAWYTKPPQKREPRAETKRKCQAAAAELAATWAKCLKRADIPLSALSTSVRIKRTTPGDITTEILKYAVKMEDLLSCAEPVGPLLRAMQGCRLVTSFGSLYGRALKSAVVAAEEEDGVERVRQACGRCGSQAFITERAATWLCRV